MAEIDRETDKLTPSQERAILALLNKTSIGDAAAKTRVSETSLFRWLKDEAFSKAYFSARRETTTQAIAQLQRAGCEAVETLRNVMKDSAATAGARMTAAKAVLELSIKAVELEDLAQRVDELEKRLPTKG